MAQGRLCNQPFARPTGRRWRLPQRRRSPRRRSLTRNSQPRVKDALREANRPDLLARNPLLRDGSCNHGGPAGPQELRSLLRETVGTWFGNPRDETLRRVLELTYGHAALKQEVVADRLSLLFGTYRRHLSTARERLARWLWKTHQVAQAQAELPSAEEPTAEEEKRGGETGILPVASEPTLPRLSLVVLPFVSIGSNAEDDHFADGITESLTTDLWRRSGVFAISRSTAPAYKGKPIDTRQIGRELGARYVLEAARRARRFFEAALRLDGYNVDALLGFADTHMSEVNMYASDDRAGQIRAAEAAAIKALALAPDNANAHVTYGTVLYAMCAPEHALREFKLAIGLDGNLAIAHASSGMKFSLGRPGETRAHVEEAIRLSPRDPLLFRWHFFIGSCRHLSGPSGSRDREHAQIGRN
jgi:TolB-like protein